MSAQNLCAIICTKNRADDLDLTLQSLLSQSRLPETVIIVDDSTGSGTGDLIRGFAARSAIHFVYVRPPVPSSGLPAARNTGLRSLPENADIVLFLDDDVTLEKDYLRAITDFFSGYAETGGCTGFITGGYRPLPAYLRLLLRAAGLFNPVLVPVSLFRPVVTRTGEACGPLFRKPGTLSAPAEWLSGSNMAYRRGIFNGGVTFDERLVGYAIGEDMLFSHRLFRGGKPLAIIYSARLAHRVSATDRIPPLSRFVMTIAYRRYALEAFHGRTIASRCLFRLFLLQFLSAAILYSLKSSRNLQYAGCALEGYRVARGIFRQAGDDYMAAVNRYCGDQPGKKT